MRLALIELSLLVVLVAGCTADITASTRAHFRSTEKDMYATQSLLKFCRAGSTAPVACDSLNLSLVEEAQTMRQLQGLPPLVPPPLKVTP